MYRGATTLDTFRRRYQDSASGCWLWHGHVGSDGYGRFNKTTAHRAAYLLLVGEVPEGHEVCHRCDVRVCVNPAHLFLGTHVENIADMVRKGRRAPTHGAANPRAKLSAAQVAAIRADTRPQSGIAKAFGICLASVSNIRLRRSWNKE